MNPKIDSHEEFVQEVDTVCDIYRQAPDLEEQGVHVASCDEKTGIQALERCAPTKPSIPGSVAKIEHEYERHGTLSLIATFLVANGKIEASLGPTRTEQDFVDHIESTVNTDPDAGWIFVADQLNTHKSESLVRYVNEQCELDADLGKKGKSGILENQDTRAAFLANPEHRIRFVYTPKHCSWLNQVERWFSVLARRLLKGLSVTSLSELKKRLVDFIDYFNKTLAKPYKWNYSGIKILEA